MRRLIDMHPEFDPRAWLAELPPMDAFGALIFQIIGQQLSVQASRRLLDRLQDEFDRKLPTPVQLLNADPDTLRTAGLSSRKVQTMRALAAEFADQRITERALHAMTDAEIETSSPRFLASARGRCTAS